METQIHFLQMAIERWRHDAAEAVNFIGHCRGSQKHTARWERLRPKIDLRSTGRPWLWRFPIDFLDLTKAILNSPHIQVNRECSRPIRHLSSVLEHISSVNIGNLLEDTLLLEAIPDQNKLDSWLAESVGILARVATSGSPARENFTPPLPKRKIKEALRLCHRNWGDWRVEHAAALRAIAGATLKDAKYLSVNLDLLPSAQRDLLARLVERRVVMTQNAKL